MYFLPPEIIRIIKEFSMPMSRSNWREGTFHSNTIKLLLNVLKYKYFSNYEMTLAGFLIYNNTLKTNTYINSNYNIILYLEVNNLNKKIIKHIEEQFLLQGRYV